MDILVIIVVAATIIIGFLIFGPSRETVTTTAGGDMTISQELELLQKQQEGPPSRQTALPSITEERRAEGSKAPAPRENPFKGNPHIREIPDSSIQATEQDAVPTPKRTSSQKRKDGVADSNARMEKQRKAIEAQNEKDREWHEKKWVGDLHDFINS